ncbi:hypothetical protein [Desulfosarcina ovata]|nr:hypothetical protein [Desulfosarcina ovata]
MLDNILMDKEVLRKWLKAGYMENGTIYATERARPRDEKKASEYEKNMDETKVLVQWLKTVDLLNVGKG